MKGRVDKKINTSKCVGDLPRILESLKKGAKLTASIFAGKKEYWVCYSEGGQYRITKTAYNKAQEATAKGKK